jgi:hypothetical protein
MPNSESGIGALRNLVSLTPLAIWWSFLNGSDVKNPKPEQLAALQKLEESLWIAKTRYDDQYMETIFADDFIEFGKSGKRYQRNEMFLGGFDGQKIDCKLPLIEFRVRRIGPGVVQTLYISEVHRNGNLERSNRSSIWRLVDGENWQLVFHQGTPFAT